MGKYSVSVIFDACKSVVVEAESAEIAADLAYDEAGYASLCHQCSGEIEVADAIRAIVYDENGDEVFDDGHEHGVIAKLELEIQELRQERQREHDLRVSLAGELEAAKQHGAEVLEALEAVIEWYDMEADHSIEPDFYKRMAACKVSEDMAREAIAKAKGGAA